jgi:hypothetical protein
MPVQRLRARAPYRLQCRTCLSRRSPRRTPSHKPEDRFSNSQSEQLFPRASATSRPQTNSKLSAPCRRILVIDDDNLVRLFGGLRDSIKSGPRGNEPDLPADLPGIQGGTREARKATP